MDSSLPGSSVHENLQVRKLKRVAVRFNRESSHPRDGTGASCIAGGFFTSWANSLGLCPGLPCAAEALTSSENKGKLSLPVQPDHLPPWELLRGPWRMARATSTARGFLEGKSTLLQNQVRKPGRAAATVHSFPWPESNRPGFQCFLLFSCCSPDSADPWTTRLSPVRH